MAGGSLRGPVVGRDGRRRPSYLDSFALLSVLVSGDFDQTLRAAYPGAVRAALEGDLAPMLRLKARSEALESPGPPRLLSAALNAATLCEETAFPWERTAPLEDRMRQAAERAAALPESAFFPFDRAAALRSDLLTLCERWPARPEAPALADGPFSAVPALILEGEEDLRTPLESGRHLASRMPGAQLVSVSETGHSVVGSDFTGCAEKAIRLFFRGRDASGRCHGERLAEPAPPPPRSLAQVRPARGVPRSAARTVSAIVLTFNDALDSSLSLAQPADADVVRVGGLRGGRFRLSISGVDEDAIERGDEDALDRVRVELRFDRYEYVPGVQLTGAIRSRGFASSRGQLEVRGNAAARGTVRLRSDKHFDVITGRLGGRRVRFRHRAPRVELASGSDLPLVSEALALARRVLSRPPAAR
jgi:pimeloyl-ACP methyl ester carboxylesterase